MLFLLLLFFISVTLCFFHSFLVILIVLFASLSLLVRVLLFSLLGFCISFKRALSLFLRLFGSFHQTIFLFFQFTCFPIFFFMYIWLLALLSLMCFLCLLLGLFVVFLYSGFLDTILLHKFSVCLCLFRNVFFSDFLLYFSTDILKCFLTLIRKWSDIALLSLMLFTSMTFHLIRFYTSICFIWFLILLPVTDPGGNAGGTRYPFGFY